MRAVARHTASQVALRNCSNQVAWSRGRWGRARSMYVISAKGELVQLNIYPFMVTPDPRSFRLALPSKAECSLLLLLSH